MMQTAMEHISAAGYSRVGLLLDESWDRLVDRNWSAGYLSAQQSYRELDRLPIFSYRDTTGPVDEGSSDGVEAAIIAQLEIWLARHHPEVVMGYGAVVLPWLEALADRGLPHPAFVDIQLEREGGEIAGIRHNSREVGETAVEILAGQLRQNRFGVPRLVSTTLIEGTWCDGDSLPNWCSAESQEPLVPITLNVEPAIKLVHS